MSAIYIRTDGNDSNSGSADSAAGAKLTLAGAVAIATSGDSFVFGAGTFNAASVDASALSSIMLVGAGKSLTIISSILGSTIKIGGGWTITDATIDGSADATAGWPLEPTTGTSNLTILDCILIGTLDGFAAINITNLIMRRCTVSGTYDGINITGAVNPILDTLIVSTDSSYSLGVQNTRGLVIQGCTNGLVTGCSFTVTRANTASGSNARRTIGISYSGTVQIDHTTISVNASNAGYRGSVSGIEDFGAELETNNVRFESTTITLANSGAGAKYDIFAGLGVIRDGGSNTYTASRVVGYVQGPTDTTITKVWSKNGVYSHTFPLTLDTTKAVTVRLKGGGGAGGARATGEGGGGGGAFSESVITPTPGETVALYVGQGGASSAGEFSEWEDPAVLTAAGGLRGSTSTLAGGLGGDALTSEGDTLFAGGNGAAGTATDGGGGGGCATAAGTGGNGSGTTGGTGTGSGGAGGATTVAGILGTNPGGGGGGGGSVANAAGGADGQVMVTYSITGPSTAEREQQQQYNHIRSNK